MDVGVRMQGYHADAALTVGVGEVARTTTRLLDVTRASLWKGIEQVRLGNSLQDVSRAIQHHVESNGFAIVRDMVGHGIGRSLHEEPQVPNYTAPEQQNPPLRAPTTLSSSRCKAPSQPCTSPIRYSPIVPDSAAEPWIFC